MRSCIGGCGGGNHLRPPDFEGQAAGAEGSVELDGWELGSTRMRRGTEKSRLMGSSHRARAALARRALDRGFIEVVGLDLVCMRESYRRGSWEGLDDVVAS